MSTVAWACGTSLWLLLVRYDDAVPFDGVCVLTIDPATLLPTSEVVENGLPAAAMARLTEIEIREPDYNKFDALARAARPAASLSEATRGRLDQSRRQRELRRPSGFEDELRAVLISDSETWGALTLLRERGRRHFTQADVRRVTSLTSTLAEGLRRALLLGELSVSDETAVGLILLADDNSIEQASPAARELLEELGPEGAGREHVPIVIQAVASRARSTAAGETRDDPIARARVRTRSGRWLVAHGAVLGDGPAAKVAVILEPARAPELAPLIAAAYGLTERERTGHPAGRPGIAHQRHRRSPAPVSLDRAGSPEGDLHQDRYRHARRARRPPLLRPLRGTSVPVAAPRVCH